LDFSAHPSKNPLVRGVNSYAGGPQGESDKHMAPVSGLANRDEPLLPLRMGRVREHGQSAAKHGLNIRQRHPVLLALGPVGLIPVKPRHFHRPTFHSFSMDDCMYVRQYIFLPRGVFCGRGEEPLRFLVPPNQPDSLFAVGPLARRTAITGSAALPGVVAAWPGVVRLVSFRARQADGWP